MNALVSKRGAAEWLLVACGVWLLGLGLYFIFVRPPLLPEDVRYMGADTNVVQAALPGLASWLGKVFTVMGGFMASAGVLVVYISWWVLPTRPRRGVIALTLAGITSVGLMSAVNFALQSDFRWLLVVPAMVWALATAALFRRT